jgi:hypothetical protein
MNVSRGWLIVAGVAAAVVFFAAVGQHSGSTPGSSASEVSLVPEHSLCLVDPAGARIHFRISVSNVGTGSQTVYVTPWRRYSDNSVNDSFVDRLTLDVPTGETMFRADFGYNAERHSLIECGVKMPWETEPTLFTVA